MSSSHSFVAAWDQLDGRVQRERIGLVILLLLGFSLRLAPLLGQGFPTDLPLNGGGLYYQFSITILDNGFSYPRTIPFYTPGGIPFAYPPLVFYFVAAVAKFTPLSAYTLHTDLPVLVSCLTLVAFYALARTVFDDHHYVLFATFVYAVLPSAFADFLTGEGLVEGTGTLLFILGVISLYRLFEERSRNYVLVSGVLFALCVLSSPGGGFAFAITLAVFALFEHRQRSNVWLFASVAAIGFVGSAPWWLTVIEYHGFEVLLNGFTSKESSLSVLLKPIIYFQGDYTDVLNSASFFWGGLLLLGALSCVFKRKFLLPTWLVGLMISDELRYITPIPIVLLITIGLFEVALPGLRESVSSASVSKEWLTGIVIALLVVHGVGIAALDTVHGEYNIHEASAGSLEAIHWIEAETPADSTFLVVYPSSTSTFNSWWFLDWFPTLTQRTTINTDYGSEWTGEQPAIIALNRDLNDATTRGDLARITEQRDISYTHLYVTRSSRTEPLIHDLRSADGMRVVFENDRAVVFERTGAVSGSRDRAVRPRADATSGRKRGVSLRSSVASQEGTTL